MMWMRKGVCLIAALLAAVPAASTAGTSLDENLQKIKHVVVIYAENRSFDNIFGLFPGADGIGQALADPKRYRQVDHDGTVLQRLPPVWLDAKSDIPTPDPRFKSLPNAPFQIDDVNGPDMLMGERTRDLVHMFFQHKEQLDGGRLDKFAAVSDAGGLVMAYYDGRDLELSKLAQQYALADHFFTGAFGGSFLNHMWLVCACAPKYQAGMRDGIDYPPLDPESDAARKSASRRIAVLGDNMLLARAPDSRPSALDGPPVFETPYASYFGNVEAGKLVYYAVNTLQPAYAPTRRKPAPGSPQFADPSDPEDPDLNLRFGVLPPLVEETIGDRLEAKGTSWAWYAEGWDAAIANPNVMYSDKLSGYPNFHPHHQPFNYFAKFSPATPQGRDERARHLKDAGTFLADLENATGDFVAFYKPQGTYNQHPGYTDITTGDRHIAKLIRDIMKTTAWASTMIIVTYDENGGFWDHVPPPAGGEWGPGSRVPAIIISPYSKCGIDSTPYDTTSIQKFLNRRFHLAPLPGLAERKFAGDLTAALDFTAAHPDGCPVK